MSDSDGTLFRKLCRVCNEEYTGTRHESCPNGDTHPTMLLHEMDDG